MTGTANAIGLMECWLADLNRRTQRAQRKKDDLAAKLFTVF